MYGEIDEEVAVANARLIASAPRMKEALEEIKESLPIKNDLDAYLYELTKWALREGVRPNPEDFGVGGK